MIRGEQLAERLIGAIERAAVAQQVRAELAEATQELATAEGRVTQLGELETAQERDLRVLEQRGWARLLRFATGSLDEDLRVERAKLETARGRVVEATGQLEDAQTRIAGLTAQLGEFADAREQLTRALVDREAWVHRTGDWRAGQLRGLRRRSGVLAEQTSQIRTAAETLSRTVGQLGELAESAEQAIAVGALAGPSSAMATVDQRLTRSRLSLTSLWSELETAPIRLQDLRPATALPRVDLTTPEVVLGFSTAHLDLGRLRTAALEQQRRLQLIGQRLRDEIAHRETLQAEVAGLRQNLLVLPDRAPALGADALPDPPWPSAPEPACDGDR